MATDTGKSGRSRPNARARSAALREQQRKKEARRKMLTIGGIGVVVLAVIAVMVIIYANKSPKANAATRQPAPASVVKSVTTVPAATFEKVDTSALTGGPTKITGSPLTSAGKPEVLYLGAEYCPYCATERWPMVVALSRFGAFSNLKTTTSSSQDVYPNTPTFSFYGSKYNSPYVTFTPVETETNQRVGNSYTPLETPTAEQQALITKYDNPGTSNAGSIPFLDFGNKFVSSGATYQPSVLKGKSLDEIAAAVSDPTSDIGKGVLGAANTFTAAICNINGAKPADVCDSPTITKLRSTLNASK